MSVTRWIDCTTSSIVRPAWSTCCVPASTLLTESSISVLISLAAAALRCARLRTSLATTAKPRPCSPARAASTAAFSARMLVWNAIPSITPMMSAIFFDDSEIPLIVSTTCLTTAPPFPATSDAPTASALACFAFSAFCLTVLVSSSIDDAVSSSDDACSSVRCERSWFPAAISLDAVAIVSVPVRTSRTTDDRLSFMRFNALSRSPVSSAVCASSRTVRSPPATASAARTAFSSGLTIERARSRPKAAISATSAAPATHSSATARPTSTRRWSARAAPVWS